MTEPPTAECFRCGQSAYVGPDGIRCFCTNTLSAQEHHEAGNARPCGRCGLPSHHIEVRTRTRTVHHIDSRAVPCVLPNLDGV